VKVEGGDRRVDSNKVVAWRDDMLLEVAVLVELSRDKRRSPPLPTTLSSIHFLLLLLRDGWFSRLEVGWLFTKDMKDFSNFPCVRQFLLLTISFSSSPPLLLDEEDDVVVGSLPPYY